ncbi:hypothetical protein KQH56_02710 [bacterium]|nr:hypothetical protein [bacterium]
MDEHYDWSKFYMALCKYGPDLLLGINEDLREIIKEISSTSDVFWSARLEDCLAEGASADSISDGIFMALDQWLNNVINALDASFGITLDKDLVTINRASPLIDLLIEATSQS